MNLSEKINQLKANLTKEDLEAFDRDIKAKLFIDATFENINDVHKFLMLYVITFISSNGLEFEDFINDLRRAQSAFAKLEECKSRGH